MKAMLPTTGALSHFAILFALMGIFMPATALAQASEERLDVAVFELDGEGIDDDLAETLTAVLRQEAQQHAGYSLVNPASLQRHEVALIVGCDPQQVECLREMAQYVDGQVLIFGEVRPVAGGLLIAVDILHVERGTDPIRVERVIDDAGDPVIAFQREVEGVFRSLVDLGETHLIVRAPQEDMAIRLEDITIGYGQVERRGLPPGVYRITVGEVGAALWEGDVELTPGRLVEITPVIEEQDQDDAVLSSDDDDTVVAEMHLEETPVPMPPDGPRAAFAVDERDRQSNLGAYSLMTVGLVSLGGSALMAYLMGTIEETIASENEAGTMTLRRYEDLNSRGRSYETGHYVLLSVGVASLAVGTGWVLWNYRRERSLRADIGDSIAGDIEIIAHGAGLGLRARW